MEWKYWQIWQIETPLQLFFRKSDWAMILCAAHLLIFILQLVQINQFNVFAFQTFPTYDIISTV